MALDLSLIAGWRSSFKDHQGGTHHQKKTKPGAKCFFGQGVSELNSPTDTKKPTYGHGQTQMPLDMVVKRIGQQRYTRTRNGQCQR